MSRVSKVWVGAAFILGLTAGGFLGSSAQLSYLCAEYPEEMDRLPGQHCFYD